MTTRATAARQIPWARVARVVGGLAAAVALAYGTLIAFFIGAIVTTGCFFECNDPNPVGGLPILASAGLLAGATITATVWAVTTRRLWPLVKTVGTVSAGLGVIAALVLTSGTT